MVDYQKLYLHLFNRVTDALREMDKRDMEAAWAVLILAQQECEELYLAFED